MGKKCQECKAGAPDWMVTFADLMSLLLTFFVLLLSFSNMEIVKFRTMAGSVKNALGLKSPLALSDIPTGDTVLPVKSPKDGSGKDRERIDQRQAGEEIKKELEKILNEEGLAGKGDVQITDRGVVLQLQGDMLFESGSAEIQADATTVLDRLAEYVAQGDRSVDVLGHTDDRPIATGNFPSNWELSAARAGTAVRYFSKKGVPADRMRAVAHADTVPVAENTSGEGRSKNRRIEFVFVAGSGGSADAARPAQEEDVSLADEIEDLTKAQQP